MKTLQEFNPCKERIGLTSSSQPHTADLICLTHWFTWCPNGEYPDAHGVSNGFSLVDLSLLA